MRGFSGNFHTFLRRQWYRRAMPTQPTHSTSSAPSPPSPNTPRVRRPPADASGASGASGVTRASKPRGAPEPRHPNNTRRTERIHLTDAPRASTISTWALLPLRLFLGVTFVYAGLQKLTDPQYFKTSAPGYIGKQIVGFAHGSPIGGFLLHVAVPHATLFGALVAYGELAIGLGALVGLLFRPAACFGALLSLTFFLSASWRVYPYFYGADIVFLFGWVTLALAGPLAGGWPAFDALLVQWIVPRMSLRYQDVTIRAFAIVLGTDGAAPRATSGGVHEQSGAEALAARTSERAPSLTARHAQQAQQMRSGHPGRSARPVPRPTRGRGRYAAPTTRRAFIRGGLAGAASMLGLVFLVSLFRQGDGEGGAPASSTGSTSGAGTGASSTPASTAGAGTASAGGSAIAQASSVPANSAAQFTIPSNGDPGILVHLSGGQFVAFDATCTHAGCPVQYDPGSQLLICPCHGAEFDPAHQAAVVQGPAGTPLVSVPVHVDNASGTITLG